MTYSPAAYVATAGQRDFNVPFPYINQNHVVVLVNGNLTPVFEWPSSTKLRLWSPLAGGESVVIERRTPGDGPLVKFQSGAILTQEDLNLAVRQLLFRQQELDALYEGSLRKAQLRLAENLGIVTDPEAVSQQLAELVLEQQVLDDFRQRIADIDLNAQGLLQQGILIEGISEAVDALGDFDGSGFITLVQQESAQRIAADQAISQTVSLIGTAGPGGNTFVLDLDTALVSETESLGSRFATIQSSIEDTSAAVLSEQQARVSADDALANSISLLQTEVGDNSAAILNEQQARTTAINSLANQVSGIDAQVGQNSASIIAEQQARVSADNALAQDISSVQSQLNGNTASVNTLQSAVNGLQARYGVQLNVNGHITGFVQNNDGETGDFTVVADRFSIIDPNGGSPLVPFEVSGGVTRIREAAIGSLSVDKLSGGVLGAQVTQNGDWIVGTGRIVWDNGVFMKVAGVGFGTQGQFIEWFGPRKPINQCDEQTAIQYLKTNGDAFFGGTLRAGTLRNAVQTTSTTANAAVSTGQFGSNGNIRNVVVSYAFLLSVGNAGPCDGSGLPSATIRLRRNGVIIQTWTVTGSVSCSEGFGFTEPGSYSVNMSQSWTFADASGGTSVEYTAEIVERILPTAPSSTTGQSVFQQSLGIVSTEE